MTPKLLTPIALLVLAACEPAAERERPETTASATPVPTEAPSPSPPASETTSSRHLIGEYRVAGIGGQDINLPYGITVSIDADTIHLTADCVNVEWGYTVDADGTLSTTRVPTEGCARGLHPLEDALVEAFDGAERVTRTPSNGYEFSGRGPTATLFTQ